MTDKTAGPGEGEPIEPVSFMDALTATEDRHRSDDEANTDLTGGDADGKEIPDDKADVGDDDEDSLSLFDTEKDEPKKTDESDAKAKEEDKEDSDDPKKTKKLPEDHSKERGGNFAKVKAELETVKPIAAKVEEYGGLEAVDLAIQTHQNLYRPGNIDKLVAEVATLPHAGEIAGEFFWQAWDNPDNRVDAFNDMLTGSFSLDKGNTLSRSELEEVGTYIATSLKQNKADFLDEIRGTLKDSGNKAGPDWRDDKIAELESQLTSGDTKDAKDDKSDPVEAYNKQLQEDFKFFDSFNVKMFDEIPEATEKDVKTGAQVLKKFGLVPSDKDTPEVAAGKAEFARIIRIATIVDMNNVNGNGGDALATEVRSRLKDIKSGSKNAYTTNLTKRYKNALGTRALKSLTLITKALKGRAVVAPPPNGGDSQDVLTKQDLKSDLSDTPKEVDLRTTKSPFRSALNKVEGRRT